MQIVTLLLAAGTASRFGGNKLRHPLANGTPVAEASIGTLLAAGCKLLAISHRKNTEINDLLQQQGIRVIHCTSAQPGIGSSIAQAVTASADADGWIIALADMPYLRPATVMAVHDQLCRGSGIVVPQYRQQNGHPVGFAKRFLAELVELRGDTGARRILQAHPQDITTLGCNDPGILHDIDTPEDILPR